MPIVAAIVLWIIIATLALVALMRVVAWDALEVFAVLNTVTLFVYLPAWPIAVAGIFGRRPALAVVALAIGITQIVLLVPEFAAAGPIPSWATGAPTFRLLDANVYNENRSMAGYADQIRSGHPDVITFEEATPRDVRQLRDSGVLAPLPHQFEVRSWGPFAFFVASRYPLTQTHTTSLYDRTLIVETVLSLPSGSQPLWVVHTTAPLPAAFQQWKGQLATIGRLIRARGTRGLLVTGDFNATWGNQGFRAVLATGLTDGAAARGHPLAMTWSQLVAPIPPLVRIDHVLTGPGVAVEQITTQHGAGSDHRDLLATIAVRPPRT